MIVDLVKNVRQKEYEIELKKHRELNLGEHKPTQNLPKNVRVASRKNVSKVEVTKKVETMADPPNEEERQITDEEIEPQS